MRNFIFTLFIITVYSCAPSLDFYTKNIHDSNNWTDSELSKIQFYISNDIVLWRDISQGDSEISDGKIKMVEGRKVEEVVIRRGTPGAFVFSPQAKQYAISFDAQDDSKYLIFGPSDKVNGRYVLLGKEWDRRYGKVTYGNKVYRTSAESAFAYLMVDLRKSSITKVNRERPTGRRVGN